MSKITKAELLEKLLETAYDKGQIETIEKIMKDSNKGDALDKANRIIGNINSILEDFIKKYKPLIN